MRSLSQLKILIVGLGQIGGSLGMDLVKRRLVAEVIGFDTDELVLKRAKELGVVDGLEDSLTEGIGRADLTILAVPIREIKRLLKVVGQSISEDAAVLDVGSTKVEILSMVSQQKQMVNFIGGHPLAGSEGHGLESAQTGKFAGTVFVLVPHPKTRPGWIEIARRLVDGLDARPLLITAEEHDQLIALTSNLPYVLSIGLMQLLNKHEEKHEKVWELIGGSFRSATRVASSSPRLSLDMFLTNRKNVSKAIELMTEELFLLRKMVEKQDEDSLRDSIERARNKRKLIQNG